MADQLPTLGGLSSVFQLSAGVALAMSVFRAPYEQRYRHLGAILDREERLLGKRQGAMPTSKSDAVVEARVDWSVKGRDMEPVIRWLELPVWLSVVISLGLLVLAGLFPNESLRLWQAVSLVGAAQIPVFGSWVAISIYVRCSLAKLTLKVKAL